MTIEKVFTAGDWSKDDDDYSQMFVVQNLRQFWLPEEISLSSDLLTWKALSEDEKLAYMRVLGGLTLLDTIQGDVGMPKIVDTVKSHQQKAVLSFMGGMENAVHARSYSRIFITLATNEQIQDTFNWIHSNKHLQKKAKIFDHFYREAQRGGLDSYFAKVASVALESFLFYSGFFYPLYLAGQGKLRASGEIISLIIRDESIHGVYVGLLAKDELKTLDADKEEVEQLVHDLFDELLAIEEEYTREIYDPIGLTHEVLQFIKYNANKGLTNLGYDKRYDHDKVSSMVMTGLQTGNQKHDFFSQKSSSYKKPTVEATSDDDFNFD